MGKYNFDQAKFEQVRDEAEAFYVTIGSVLCPYFGEDVAFNAKGIRHLKFKSDERARSNSDQYTRLKLLKYAPEIVKQSHTVQGVWETKKFETQNINSRWVRLLKDVTFYEFMAVIDKLRIKVVIKQVAGGDKHFWSVIPFWGIDKSGGKRVLHSRGLENDD